MLVMARRAASPISFSATMEWPATSISFCRMGRSVRMNRRRLSPVVVSIQCPTASAANTIVKCALIEALE